MKLGSIVKIKKSLEVAPYKWGFVCVVEKPITSGDGKTLLGVCVRRPTFYDGCFHGEHVEETYKIEELEEVQ